MSYIRFRFIVVLLAVLSITAPGVSADDTIHSGTVIYTKTAGNYTYIRLKEGEKKVWLAASPMKVAVGDTVEYAGGDVMEKFESKAMKKTFDRIRFVARIHVVMEDSPAAGTAKSPGGHPGVASKDGSTVPPTATPTVPVPRKGEIGKAEKGKTVEEIFADREKLKDRSVTLRGKVVKVSRNILMKNWVTLSDGTGTKPDDRIVAVTTDNVALGATVMVKGIVKTGVNLGAGYKYKVLIDDAVFAK